MSEVQDYPSVDSINADSFESLVELYYQTQGYITSSNKWFWYYEEGKKQRGYRDIDVLAIKENETLIIAVTQSLKSKIRNNKDDMIHDNKQYFEQVEAYFKNVQQYAWLVNNRKIRRIIVYADGKNLGGKVESELENAGIELKYVDEIIKDLKQYIADKKTGIKTNNQLETLIQLWLKVDSETVL